MGEKVDNAEISIIFANNDYVTQLNKEYLSHYWDTDVIAFNFDDSTKDGEVYISVETAQSQAFEYKVSLTDELIRLALHGTLHIIGYDDSTISEKEEMHRLEDKYLKLK